MRSERRFYAGPAAVDAPSGGGPSLPPLGEVDERLHRYVCAVEAGGAPERELESVAAGLDPASSALLRERVAKFHRLGVLLDRRDAPSLAGRLLAGRYRLVREIGRGGMGAVYEAVDVQLERHVAVKLLLEAASFNEVSRRLFLREAVLLARIQHTNVASVHELSRDGELEFIVMDLVAGRDLAQVLRRVSQAQADSGGRPRDSRSMAHAIDEPLPPGATDLCRGTWFEAAARVTLEVARTLEAAHAAGVIHRDLKPQNVMLRGGGTPVILDFGLAGVRQEEGEARTRGLFGTVSYLAPEQASGGEMGTEPRTDVYQVGVMLYELLTLRRAFGGGSTAEVLHRIGHGEFRRPRAIDRGIPFDLEAICLRAMELRPAARYANMTELREDLERFLGGDELPFAARGGWLASAARSSRYVLRRRRVQTAAAAALLVGALGGWAMYRAFAPPSAVEFRATRFREGDANPYSVVPQFDDVRNRDILGVVVEAAEPRYVYALSIFGERDPPTWVAPLPVQAVPEGAGTSPDGWCQLVEPGAARRLNCARIDDPKGPFEGLWVFAPKEPQPQLAEWMSELQRYAAEGKGQVAFETATRLLREGPPPTRGGPVRTTASERAALEALLAPGQAQGEVEWPLKDIPRYVVAFRVVKPN